MSKIITLDDKWPIEHCIGCGKKLKHKVDVYCDECTKKRKKGTGKIIVPFTGYEVTD